MSYRLSPVIVPDSDPFKNDALKRSDIVEFVAQIVSDTAENPLVLAIDSPYGTGKSTFVEMLSKVLEKRDFQTVYFNAWKADHVSDPLIAMVAALDEALPRSEGDSTGMSKNMGRVKKVAGILLKRSAAVGVKIATAGALDLSDDIEEALADAATDSTTDIIDTFEKEQEAARCFRAELEKVVASLPELNKKSTLVFFIDELDRCRPDFAMSLLERVKHMFDVPNMCFILSVDKKQLEAVTAAVYGEKIDAAEYLRKFIDLEFGLPSPSKKQFIQNAISRAGLEGKFQARQRDKENLVRYLVTLSEIYTMSLRAIERCVVRLKLVIAATPDSQSLDPIQTAVLIVLRSVDADMFNKIVAGMIDPLSAMEYFRNLPGARPKLDGQDGVILEAMLVAELWDRESINQYRQGLLTLLGDQASTPAQRDLAQRKLALLESFTDDVFRRGRLQRIAAVIDIAANVSA